MPAESKKNNDGNMPLSGHLKEMRNRILIILCAMAVTFLLCLYFASGIIEMMIRMGSTYGYQFVTIAPQEMLLVHFSVAFTGCVVLSVPVIVYQAYSFASPGLEKKEQRTVLWTAVFGMVCFAIGVCFAYKISLPFMLYFLINFGRTPVVSAAISIREYISFLTTVLIIFGTVFELPVVTALLSALGLMKSAWMAKGRKVMIVVIFFIAAIITPPDIVSQIMTGIPMCLLYELSIYICKLFEKKDQKEEKEVRS